MKNFWIDLNGSLILIVNNLFFFRYKNLWNNNEKFFLPKDRQGNFLNISKKQDDVYYTEVNLL